MIGFQSNVGTNVLHAMRENGIRSMTLSGPSLEKTPLEHEFSVIREAGPLLEDVSLRDSLKTLVLHLVTELMEDSESTPRRDGTMRFSFTLMEGGNSILVNGSHIPFFKVF